LGQGKREEEIHARKSTYKIKKKKSMNKIPTQPTKIIKELIIALQKNSHIVLYTL
jgi:hypothetical protein